jgi:hypothetical protein
MRGSSLCSLWRPADWGANDMARRCQWFCLSVRDAQAVAEGNERASRSTFGLDRERQTVISDWRCESRSCGRFRRSTALVGERGRPLTTPRVIHLFISKRGPGS